MSKKRKSIIAAVSALLLLLALAAALLLHQKHSTASLEESYLQKDLASYSEIHVIASDVNVDGETNSPAALKEAVRLGADTVTLDLCFQTDGTPVICESFDAITKDTLSLEEVFRLLQDSPYQTVGLHLRLRQLVSLDAFNALLTKYAMSDRVFLSGIDENRYGILTGDQTAANVFYDYTPAASPSDAVEEIQTLRTQYGAAGVIIENQDADAALIAALNDAGIPFILRNVNQTAEMYEAIDAGVYLIQTKDPGQLTDIFSKWKDATQKRLDTSVLSDLQK